MQRDHVLKVIAAILGIGILIELGTFGYSRVRSHFMPAPTNDVAIVTPRPKASVSILPTLVPTPNAVISPAPGASPVVVSTPTPTPAPAATILDTINLDIPFTSQAPSANWDATHEETCEEATMLMAQWFATGQKGAKANGYQNQIPPDKAEAALQDMITWENKTLGDFKDTTADQTVRLAKENLGLKNVRTSTDVSADSIKKELNAGNIIVVPAAGKLLANPYFRSPGPPYHMVLIRGYDSKGVISNDPGTRRGEGFVYSFDNLISSTHDWTGKADTITEGRKVMIVISPN